MSFDLMTPSRALVRTRWVSVASFLGTGWGRVKSIRAGRWWLIRKTAVVNHGWTRMNTDGNGEFADPRFMPEAAEAALIGV